MRPLEMELPPLVLDFARYLRIVRAVRAVRHIALFLVLTVIYPVVPSDVFPHEAFRLLLGRYSLLTEKTHPLPPGLPPTVRCSPLAVVLEIAR